MHTHKEGSVTMEKDRRPARKLHIARAALSLFIALALCVHAPLEVRAASFSFTMARNNLFNGTYSYAAETLRIGFGGKIDVTTKYNGSGPSQVNAVVSAYGAGTLHFDVDLPIKKTYNITPYDASFYSCDFLMLELNSEVVPRVSASLYSGNIGTAEVLNLRAATLVSYGGQDYELGPGYNYINIGHFAGSSVNLAVRLSFDVSYNISDVGTSGVDAPGSVAGYVTIMPSFTVHSSALYAATLVSTGEERINGTLANLSTWLNTMLNAIYTKIGAESSAIQLKIQAQIDNDNTNRDKIISALNANSKAEIADADRNAANIISILNANHKAQVDNDDKNADDIMNSYDKSVQDSDNKRFEDSRKELQEQEDSLFSSATEGFGSLDMSDYSFGRFSAMQGAFSFVSGFIQSCYVKMGDFGAVVTVGLVLLIATKVIGLFRFQVVEH